MDLGVLTTQTKDTYVENIHSAFVVDVNLFTEIIDVSYTLVQVVKFHHLNASLVTDTRKIGQYTIILTAQL